MYIRLLHGRGATSKQVSPSFSVCNAIYLQRQFFPLLIRTVRKPLQVYDNVVGVGVKFTELSGE
jgi:hypothetical protein